jgi:hypothetical protein
LLSTPSPRAKANTRIFSLLSLVCCKATLLRDVPRRPVSQNAIDSMMIRSHLYYSNRADNNGKRTISTQAAHARFLKIRRAIENSRSC